MIIVSNDVPNASNIENFNDEISHFYIYDPRIWANHDSKSKDILVKWNLLEKQIIILYDSQKNDNESKEFYRTF